MLPTLFVSHGAPTLVHEDVAARAFLRGLGGAVSRPKAVLAVSAHWETAVPTVATTDRPETIHDFHGFPPDLYRLRYPAPGAPSLARQAAAFLTAAGLGTVEDPTRGFDHGAWVPLLLMYPDADIPAAQISIQTPLGPAHHVAVGRALAPLREQGVLVLASGGAVHNLRALRWNQDSAPAPWAAAFDAWLAERIAAGAVDDLVSYRSLAPGGNIAHPRDEHLLPLFVALGAAGANAKGRRLHDSFTHGSLSMAAFSFS